MLTRSFVGTNSIGASAQTPATNTAYVKAVTIPANSVLSAIEAHLALTDTDQIGFRVAVWSDNAGSLDNLIRLCTPANNTLVVGGTDRWVAGPVGMWFGPETDVWIGVHIYDPGSTTLAFAGSGSDVTVASGGTWTGEDGAVGVTVSATTNDYSIRGVVIA